MCGTVGGVEYLSGLGEDGSMGSGRGGLYEGGSAMQWSY